MYFNLLGMKMMNGVDIPVLWRTVLETINLALILVQSTNNSLQTCFLRKFPE